jgi:mannose-6-phosphate isomerase-like protein (cupin superfamily)
MNLIDKNNAEHYAWGGICEGWHLAKAGTLSVVEERIPPGGSEVRHRHQRALQFFYVLKGVLSFEVEGMEHDLSPRQGIEIRPSVAHRVFNRSAADAEFLVISTPPSHSDREPA